MAIGSKSKGIYCIEGLWEPNDIKDKTTVLPILDLLEKRGYCNYIYHNCATAAELEFFLAKWKTKAVNKKYPILYLVFHGEIECIFLNNKERYSLDQLSEFIKSKCQDKVIYFGSCSTLNTEKRKIKSFLQKTGAIAIIGYNSDINWIQSTACDLLVFEALQNYELNSKGIGKIYNKIKSDYGNLHKMLGLSIMINGK